MSYTSEGTGASVTGVLSLRDRALVASLTTIIYHSFPIDNTKSVLGLSGIAKDDVV